MYNDLYVTDANGNEQVKAGVGLEVIQNVPSPFEISYTGKFFLPSQTVSLSGQPSFTRSTGNVVASAEVLQNMIQPQHKVIQALVNSDLVLPILHKHNMFS